MSMEVKERQESSSSITPLNPEWVSMEIDKLGKSMYNSEEQPLEEAARSLKNKMLMKGIRERCRDVIVECSRTTDGLVNNENRLMAWPFLLSGEGVDVEGAGEEGQHKSEEVSKVKLDMPVSSALFLEEMSLTDQEPHPDEDQVKLDIQRSFTVLSHLQSFRQVSQNDSYTTIFSNSDIEDLKKKLFTLVVKMLRKYPSLNYYQGYHDVAGTVLLVCYSISSRGNFVDEQAAFKILEKLTLLHLRDFMLRDINLSVNHLKLVPTILQIADPDLFALVKHSSNSYILGGDAFYDYNFYPAISSIITLFSHDISHIQHVLLIWDFVLSYNSVMTTVYIYVAALIHYKEHIFTALNLPAELDLDEEPLNFDKDLAHALLSPSKLFSDLDDVSLIKILSRTKALIENVSISDLDNSETYSVFFKDFNKHSVLLTTSNLFPDEKEGPDRFDFCSFQNESELSASVVASLIEIQDEEMRRQGQYQEELEAKLASRQDELANSFTTEYESSSLASLASSLSSLASTSSTLNNKFVRSSSLYFKKLFDISRFNSPSPEDDFKAIIPGHNGKISLLYRNIPKFSITLGFIGFFIHFLMVRNDVNLKDLSVSKVLVYYMVSLKSIGVNMLHDLSANGVSYELKDFADNMFTNIKDSGIVRSSISVGQVGINNLRYTVFGFGA